MAGHRFLNLSTRAIVATGGDIMIAGFVVDGERPMRVLVRAIGPTLGTFGVTGALTDPQISVLTSSGALAANNNDWGDNTSVRDAAASVGAFALTAGSRDAALIATLSPGAYTAQVSGVNNSTGIALVEVYELP
jgi:hypothetical protein